MGGAVAPPFLFTGLWRLARKQGATKEADPTYLDIKTGFYILF
jgi:hypothetical protein